MVSAEYPTTPPVAGEISESSRGRSPRPHRPHHGENDILLAPTGDR
jgi:hypothetical protein